MSEFFQWDSGKFGLGVHSMDEEHRTLIGLMNTLHTLHTRNAETASLKQALDAFVKFTGKHFADEEAYMERIGFPGLRIHKGVHGQLLARVGEFLAEFHSTGRLTDQFFGFLRNWLSAHICGIDAKYAAHANQTKAG